MALTDDEVFGPAVAAPAATPRMSVGGGGMSDEEVFGKAAAPSSMDVKPGGFLEEAAKPFKKAFKDKGIVEGVIGLLGEGMFPNFYRSVADKQKLEMKRMVEAAALKRAEGIVKTQSGQTQEAVRKAYELIIADQKKKAAEAKAGVLEPVQEMVAGAMENPGQFVGEMGTGLIRDPWQVLPVFGQIGKGGTWTGRVGGIAGAGAATNAAIDIGQQGVSGKEVDGKQVLAAAAAGGAMTAPFALLGKSPGKVRADSQVDSMNRGMAARQAAENDSIMDMAERFADARPPAEPPAFIPATDLAKMKPKERAAYEKKRAEFEERAAADIEAAATYDPAQLQAEIEAKLDRYFEDAREGVPVDTKAEPPVYNPPSFPDAELPAGHLAGIVPKGKLSESPIIGAAPDAPTPADPHITLFESARGKLIGGRAWDMTADEKVALRTHVDSVTRGGVIDPQTSRARERGQADPRLLGMMAAGVLGAAVLGTDWDDEDAKKYIAAGIAGSMGIVGRGKPFYHAMPEVLGKIGRKEGTAAEWYKETTDAKGNAVPSGELVAAMQKVGKGTPEEWREMGGPEWLAAREGKVSKAEIADFIEKGGVRVEEKVLGGDGNNFAAYDTLPPEAQRLVDRFDSEQYAPDHFKRDMRALGLDVQFDMEGGMESITRIGGNEPPQYDSPNLRLPGAFDNYRETLYKLPETSKTGGNDFTESHHPDANIVAHDRTTDRVAADGTQGTLLEEVQSDWGQLARLWNEKKKLAAELDRIENGAAGRMMTDEEVAALNKGQAKMEKINKEIRGRDEPPPGPFVRATEAWTSLAFRSALARAAAEGKDWLAWTTGKQQNERYNLRTHVEELSYQNNVLTGLARGERPLRLDLTPSELANHVGEGVARQLLAEEGRVLRGPDLEVGQKDLRPFYDKILRGIAEKVSKKLGGEGVTEIELPGMASLDPYTRMKVPEASLQPAIRITPALRERLAAGMPLHARQGGFLDPKLSAALGLGAAGAAVGAWVAGKDKRERGMVLGALAGIAAALGALSKPGAAINWGLGLVSREFNQIDPRLRRVMINFERESLENNLRDHVKAAPFVEAFRKMKPEQRAEVAIALGKRTLEARLALATKYPALKSALDAVDALVKEKSDWLRSERRFKDGPEYYWHQQVKDLDGLLNHLGREEGKGLAAELIKLENKVKAEAGRLPTEIERAEVVADWMKRTKAGLSHRAGYTKKRTVELTPELLPFYHDPGTALLSFLAEANKDIARTKLFGKNAVNKTQDGVKYLNIEASIGAVVQKQLLEGKLTDPQARKLRGLLRSRLGPGEQSMPGWHQDVQNVVTASLLGHATNAIKQVPDFALGVLMLGVRPMLEEVLNGIRGKSKISLHDLGLINNIMDEFTQSRLSSRYLTWVLNKSGFSAIDVGARHVIVNAALSKYTRDAVKGGKQLTRDYGKEFSPEELAQLQSDLVRGEKSALVKDLVFMELSDIQPVSRLERSQAYLDHPSARFMYHLKGYTMKQLDIARREVLDNARDGRYAEALKKAAGLAIVWGAVGAGTEVVVDYLLGHASKFSDKVFESIARNLGWNDWAGKQLMGEPGRGGNAAAAAGMLLAPPAAGVAYDILAQKQQAVRHIPLAGRWLYAYGMGGALEQRERELIKEGGLPQVKVDRAAREEEGNATARDKERVRMQKQKVDAQAEAARKRGDEGKADKLLERSEALRGRLEKMGAKSDAGKTSRMWRELGSKLDENARPWMPPPGFLPPHQSDLHGPVTIDPTDRDTLRRRILEQRKVM